jgi:DNA repair protein SbcC/Rad50
VKLRKLTIVRMPGFERQGFELADLGDGLNVVVGPNGSGKTTCCRAIRGLLWPRTVEGLAPLSLVGEWDDAGRPLRLELEAGRFTCQRDGVPDQPPALPGTQLAGCFTVTVDDLFAGTGDDSALARDLWREMSGGYDLAAARQSDALKLPRLHGRKEMEQLAAARREAERIRQYQEALRREEDERDQLHAREQEARLAQAKLARLDDVRELIAARADLALAEEALSAFPAGMERLHGTEGKALQETDGDLRDCEKALAKAGQEAEKARHQIDAAALPRDGIAEVRLEEQREHRKALSAAERDLREVERKLRDSDAAVAAAARAIGDAVAPERLDAVGAAELTGIEAFHRDWEDLQSRRSGLTGLLASLGEPPPQVDIDSLIGGINLLRQWLEAGPGHTAAAAAASRRPLWAALALAGVLAVAGLALAVTVNPWWAVLVLLAAAGAAWAGGSRPSQPAERGGFDGQFRRLPLPAVPAWDAESVGTHLNRLEKELAKARQDEQRGIQRRDCLQQLAQLQQRAAELSARREALVAAVGVAPETATLALVSLAANLQAYRQAAAARDALMAERRGLEDTRTATLERINQFLREFSTEDADPADGCAIADIRGREIERRAQLHRDATRALAAAEAAAKAAQGGMEKLGDRRRDLFAAAGLADGDGAKLAERLDRLAGYRSAVAGRDRLKAKVDGLAGRLRDAPELLGLTREQADAETARLTDLAESYKPLVERIADLDRRVEEARKKHSLEVALAEIDWASYRLRQCRDAAELAAAGNFLLAQIEGEHTARNQPAVLREATRLFSLFTRGRYELRLDDTAATARAEEGPAFLALDTAEGRGKALGELSRGTRMQLLLAVRLAFAATAERATALPVVLDEVLSSTDPTRFRAITECLLALVKEGRQVFYFTCQPGDAEAWHEVAAQAGADQVRRIDLPASPQAGLAEARRAGQAVSTLLSVSAARTPSVPPPDGRTMTDYAAALAVPPLDAAAGAKPAHLAHLLDEPAHLHRLLSAGVSTFGQLQSLAAHGAGDAYLPAAAWHRARGRAAVLDAFAEGWRIGRGRPLTPEAVAAACDKSKFLDRVQALAAELNWDALSLVEAMEGKRIKGFHSDALEEIRERFVEAKHLDPRPTLAREDLHARVLATAEDAVKRGDIDVAEVARLFDALWHIAARIP